MPTQNKLKYQAIKLMIPYRKKDQKDLLWFKRKEIDKEFVDTFKNDVKCFEIMN